MREKTGNGHAVDLEMFLEDLKTVVRDGQQLLRSSFTGVKERTIARARSTENAVREHPYRSVGLVFGLGVIVGLLAVSMMSSSSEEEED